MRYRNPPSLLTLSLGFLLLAPTARAQQWIPVGPPGGDVRSLAVDPLDPQRIYLGTAEGVLYRSDVSGLDWQRLHPGFPGRGQSLDEIVVPQKKAGTGGDRPEPGPVRPAPLCVRL